MDVVHAGTGELAVPQVLEQALVRIQPDGDGLTAPDVAAGRIPRFAHWPASAAIRASRSPSEMPVISAQVRANPAEMPELLP